MLAVIWYERGEPVAPAVDDDCARKLAMTKAERRLLLILAGCPTGATLDALVRLKSCRPRLLPKLVCAGLVSARDFCMAPAHELVVTSYAITPGGMRALGLPDPERAENAGVSLTARMPAKT